LPAGAVFPLLVWILLAPAGVQAGCSHLVTSRNDRMLLPSFLQGTMTDRGDATAPALPISGPRSPGPCLGLWCDAGPAVPAVPAGTVHIRDGSWAWCPVVPDPDPVVPSRLLEGAAEIHPSRRATSTFRPPRIAARA
jgi:hypothetical protein